MAKQKQSKGIRIILIAAGFLFVCGGFYLFVNGLISYIGQFGQRNWLVATASVINVDEYSDGYKNKSTRYNILYQYEAEGNIFTGQIRGSNAPKKLGETLEVKYDPDAPERSTPYLEPTFGIVASGIIGFLIFGFIGYRMIRSAMPEREKLKAESDFPPITKPKKASRKTVASPIADREIRQYEDRIFHEVCEIAKTSKEKHPSVEYAVWLECSNHPERNGFMPTRYSSWVFVSLCRNRVILESGENSGEWPGACDEIIRVKGRNRKLIISDTYKNSISEDLEVVAADYESSHSVYVENKEASDEMLAQACRVEWIE